MGGSPDVRREIMVIGDASSTAAISNSRLLVDGSGVAQSAVVLGEIPVQLTPGTINPLVENDFGSLYVDATGITPTYRAAAIAFVPLADTTFPFFVIRGSATKVVKIRHIKFSWACTTGNSAPATLSIIRYVAVSGGTPNLLTATPDDTNNPVPTATVSQYSVLPTAVTPYNAGITSAEYMAWITNAAGIVSLSPVELDFGVNGSQPIVLRGTSDFLGFKISAVAAGAPTMTIRISWTES